MGFLKSFLILTAVLVFLMAVCNFALGKVIVWCLDCVARKIGSEPIRVEAVKLLGGGQFVGVLAICSSAIYYAR